MTILDHHALEDFARLNNQLSNMQRELGRSNAQLASALQQKDRMLGMIAHDLRTPLTVIGGYTEILTDTAADRLTETERRMIHTIQKSSEYMQGLVDSVLEWAQIQQGLLKLHLSMVDLQDIINQVADIEQYRSARRHIRFDLTNPVCQITLDAHKIRQVLHNIIHNAVKYSHDHGSIAIRSLADGPQWRVEIVDHGPGIPTPDQHQLFQPFGRTSVPPVDGSKSIGLGLIICKTIIEAHGGSIGFTSTPNHRTCFWFSVPMKNTPQDSAKIG